MVSEHASPLAAIGGVDAGGQNNHVADLACALAEAGHEVDVYTRRDGPDRPETIAMRDGVRVVHVPAGPAAPVPKHRLLPMMPQFGDWLAERWSTGDARPDVAHAHFWMSGLATLSAARRTGVPVVQTYHALGSVRRRHQGAADDSPSGRIAYERTLGQQVDLVIAQCRDEVGELLRLGVPRARITLIPSGVDQRRFGPVGPVAPRTAGRARILTVGRMVERKGFADLVRAMAAVPAAECVIVGGDAGRDLAADPLGRRLRALADSIGLGDRLRLVGAVPRDDMARWYRSADVLAAVPWYEPFGLTPLEAMACGVPVVASAVGGLVDSVADRVTGVLVPPRDPDSLSTALRRLLAEPMRRQAYGTAALDRVHRCYSWPRAAAALAAAYGSVLCRPAEVVA
jgi:glycosyltransferase involved in cell wall biosynthesis